MFQTGTNYFSDCISTCGFLNSSAPGAGLRTLIWFDTFYNYRAFHCYAGAAGYLARGFGCHPPPAAYSDGAASTEVVGGASGRDA